MRTYTRTTNNTDKVQKIYILISGQVCNDYEIVDPGKKTKLHPITENEYYELIMSGIAESTMELGGDGEVIAIADMNYMD